jgi:nicotinate-nucleotide adenylyltransferase
MHHTKIQAQVKETFEKAFGRTPLSLRLQDILGEAIELSRYTDIPNLRSEAGDLMASLIQLLNENGWDMVDLLNENKAKIEARESQYKTLGRKLKVAILGGAFDPIHDGHIKVAKAVLDTSKTFDEVWLMPCFSHMYGKEMSSPEHRLAMCEIAARVDGRIKVFDFEIKNKLSGETFNTVTRLLETDMAEKEVSFSWIIGLDNANSFDSWVNYEHLERLIRFVVISRKGVEKEPGVDWFLKSPHIFIDYDGDLPEVSSTQVRDTVRHSMFPAMIENVDNEVVQYITENELYKEPVEANG